MVVNLTKIIRRELIGLFVKVVSSTNPEQKGIKGKIVDETKSTILIELDGKKRRIMKSNVELEIEGNLVQGTKLVARPEDRIKFR
jgi:ribonuclease P protein subunit POP4